MMMKWAIAASLLMTLASCRGPSVIVSTAEQAQQTAIDWMQKTYGHDPQARIHEPFGTYDKGAYWLVGASSIVGTGDGIVVRVNKATGKVELNAPTTASTLPATSAGK